MYCLAIDIGASSGRHILGWQEDGQIQTEETNSIFPPVHGACWG